MGFLSEGVAVVTGAGSGMGRCLAEQLAAMGSSLALAFMRSTTISSA